MRSLLNSDLLEIFCVVCEQGYLNRSAQKLGMTTSAISHALDRLEKRVNAELLDRNRRPVRLTEAGKTLFRESRPLVMSLKALQDRFGTLAYQRPALRVGLGEVITATISPWIIGKMEKTRASTQDCFRSQLCVNRKTQRKRTRSLCLLRRPFKRSAMETATALRRKVSCHHRRGSPDTSKNRRHCAPCKRASVCDIHPKQLRSSHQLPVFANGEHSTAYTDSGQHKLLSCRPD